jgi:hypothetical protein
VPAYYFEKITLIQECRVGHPPGRGRIQITDKIKVDIEQKEGQAVKVDLQRNPKKFYQQFTFWFSAASLTISILTILHANNQLREDKKRWQSKPIAGFIYQPGTFF